MWALFAASAALLTSFNPILYKRMLKDADATVVVWAVTVLSLPFLGLFTLALAPGLPNTDWLFVTAVIGSAALNAVAHLASARALKLANVSLVTPLLTFSPVFTILISGLFLGEIPSARGLVGVGLVLLGAYWLNRNSGAGWLAPFQSLAFTPATLFVLLAGLLWAITPLLEKAAIIHTSPRDPRFTAFVATALLVLMLTPVIARAGKSALSQGFRHRRELVFAGLIASIAPILGYTAFSLGLLGYVTTLFQLSTLMSVVWSSLFLKELGAAQRLPGALVMVAGAILIVS